MGIRMVDYQNPRASCRPVARNAVGPMRLKGFIEADNIVLRCLTQRSSKQLADIFDEPGLFDILMKYLKPHSQVGTPQAQAWGVFLSSNPKELVGVVNYHHLDLINYRAEVGCFIAEPYRRKGIMKAACTKILTMCFETLSLHRIEATVEPMNLAGIRFAEACGFRRESGLLRDRIYVDGVYRSVAMYALIREDVQTPPLPQPEATRKEG